MTTDILARIEGRIGRLTLNRPHALNALTLPMIEAIETALAAWEDDPAIRLVIVDGAGDRGLCAGGDIRALYDAALAGDSSVARAFFRAEYRMNAHIARYAKPYIAFMDGIVMGGGIGLSAHGTHRVVTERSRLAMPEVGIGFLPDVGGTWLLGRAPDRLGLHAALTAAQMGAADAMLCGLADVCVASASLPALRAMLSDCADHDEVSACLSSFAMQPPPGLFADARAWIASCYGGEHVEDIVAALAHHAAAAARHAAEEIGRKSPLSLKVTLRAIREAPGLGRLEPCLDREYRMALALLAAPDFREGVRAAIVDKDRHPGWSPSTLQAVTRQAVDAIFAAPDEGGLGLP